MRAMTSREIRRAIQMALDEVSRGLASGDMDRSGRYYSENELKERFGNFDVRGKDRRLRHATAKSA